MFSEPRTLERRGKGAVDCGKEKTGGVNGNVDGCGVLFLFLFVDSGGKETDSAASE